ncbi:hypothetical protein PHJA_000630600 [Phtheirospermum japonicum]|uniref:Uncharacterized protein n=1 Tax=Phtheirospermum japonicum TaxID=374723 RepID=A0A830BID9_9LAMI|nr:hypothetical protein PHJA_000630600 [Phtheirospermum japonicum]
MLKQLLSASTGIGSCLPHLYCFAISLHSQNNVNVILNFAVDVPNCEMDEDYIEEEDETGDATLYFCLDDELSIPTTECGTTWFAIPPPRGGVDSEGLICPVFKGPPRGGSYPATPLAIGPYIFLISDVIKGDMNMNMPPSRVVRYLDTQNVKEEEEANIWKNASPLEGEHVYSNVEPCPSNGPLAPFICIIASTIEYDTTTTIDGKPGRRARRALLFSDQRRLTFDFDTNSYELSEELFHHYPCCEGFFCQNPLIGLDKYLPVCYSGDFAVLQSRLVHLGNERLCVVWAHYDGDTVPVHCTKFSVVKEGNKYHATNVSYQVYQARHSSWRGLEAVVCTRSEMTSRFVEDDAHGVGAQFYLDPVTHPRAPDP